MTRVTRVDPDTAQGAIELVKAEIAAQSLAADEILEPLDTHIDHGTGRLTFRYRLVRGDGSSCVRTRSASLPGHSPDPGSLVA